MSQRRARPSQTKRSRSRGSRWRLSIRTKVIALSLGLLLIPLLGVRYVQQMESTLRASLAESVRGAAEAIAGALNDREDIFGVAEAGGTHDLAAAEHDIYVYDVRNPIAIDGFDSDWANYVSQLQPIALAHEEPVSAPDDVRAVFGQRDGDLYILLKVSDSRPVFSLSNRLGYGEADHIRIDVEDRGGRNHTYILESEATGWLRVTEVRYDGSGWVPVTNVSWVQAEWQHTPNGYTAEIRWPKWQLGPRLGLTVVDLDSEVGPPLPIVHSTLGPGPDPVLGRIVSHSRAVQGIVANLNRTPGRRVRIVDRYQRVRAQGGTLLTDKPAIRYPLLYRWIFGQGKLPALEPAGHYAGRLPHPEIESALTGERRTVWRSGVVAGEIVISVAHPIRVNDTVAGVAFVEQSAHSIQALRDGALTNLINTTLIAALISAPLILFFVTNVVRRLRRLRDRAEGAIDDRGRVRSDLGVLPQRADPDEIGDLETSFQSMLIRLRGYHDYLEKLASRLSHELRTPIAIVRTSLDNLDQAETADERALFSARAQEGLDRLSAILTRMSEASRLEEALQSAEVEAIDLHEFMNHAIAGYRAAWPQSRFELDTSNSPVMVEAAGDLLLQLFDKLVSNAVEFSTAGRPVVLSLRATDKRALVEVRNDGPPIDEDDKERIFQPLISMRGPARGQAVDREPHLGIGLFVARLIVQFHRGDIRALNQADGTGVAMRITLPRYAAT